MVDSHPRLRTHSRLCVKSHTESRRGKHVDVVGTIADGKGLDKIEPEFSRDLSQGRRFRIAPENGFEREPGEPAACNDEFVGALAVETQHLGNMAGKDGE